MADPPVPSSRPLIGAIAVYFGMVYGAGFVLGIVRTLWLAPRFGDQRAELLEMPVMLCVMIVAALLVVRRFIPTCSVRQALFIGAGGLGLLLIAEVLGIVLLRGERVTEYIAARDPLAGSIFLVMLLLSAIAPAALVQAQSMQRRKSRSHL